MGSLKGLRHTDTVAITRIFTLSSGSATPNSECSTCASHGLSGADRSAAKGARTTPRMEMLAAPRKKAVHTLVGGPGRSSAATTSHKMSNAGATAAVPITVGRDSRRSISYVSSNTRMPPTPAASLLQKAVHGIKGAPADSGFRSRQISSHAASRWQISHFPAFSTSNDAHFAASAPRHYHLISLLARAVQRLPAMHNPN